MAKQIVVIDDSPTHLSSFKAVFDDVLSRKALATADAVHFVFAHPDSHRRRPVVSRFPNYHACADFRELRSELGLIEGDKLILLDVNLPDVHNFKKETFELSPEILSFYAETVNADVDSCILFYSSGLQPSTNEEKLIEIGARSQSVSSIQKKPNLFDDAELVVKAGLNLFFKKPLDTYPIRLKLQALHGGHCSKKEFNEWFESLNFGRKYPDGTLQWLTSDWLRAVLQRKL